MLRLEAAGAQGGADDAARKAADDGARRLLEENRTGVLGAIMAQAFKDRGLKPGPHPDAAAVRAAVQQFPRGWLDLAETPQRFYSVRVDPRSVAHYYGQPIFAVATITNLTDQPITIGEGGVIQPGLWFDAEVQAMEAARYRGVAYERIGQTTVLPPRGGLSLMVRVDQGDLGARLNREPTPRFQITGWCTTNVRQSRKGVGPGPAGAQVPFARKMTRVGFPDRQARRTRQGVPADRDRPARHEDAEPAPARGVRAGAAGAQGRGAAGDARPRSSARCSTEWPARRRIQCRRWRSGRSSSSPGWASRAPAGDGRVAAVRRAVGGPVAGAHRRRFPRTRAKPIAVVGQCGRRAPRPTSSRSSRRSPPNSSSC